MRIIIRLGRLVFIRGTYQISQTTGNPRCKIYCTAACDSDVVIITFTVPINGTATVVVNPSDTIAIS